MISMIKGVGARPPGGVAHADRGEKESVSHFCICEYGNIVNHLNLRPIKILRDAATAQFAWGHGIEYTVIKTRGTRFHGLPSFGI
jgi:hypothetical protein